MRRSRPQQRQFEEEEAPGRPTIDRSSSTVARNKNATQSTVMQPQQQQQRLLQNTGGSSNIFGVLTSDVFGLDNYNAAQDGDTVHFVWTDATLLSGDLDECYNATDTTCRGGLAAVNAFMRANTNEDEPVTIIPALDYQTAFVQMHPVTWNVNRIVFEEMLGASRFSISSWLFDEHRNVDMLMSLNMRPLISNIEPISTESVWKNFVETIYFDFATSLAVMAIDQTDQPGVAKISSAAALKGLLKFINYKNLESGCDGGLTDYEAYQVQTTGTYTTTDGPKSGRCWIPIVVYEDRGKDLLLEFVEELSQFTYRPQLIIDARGSNVEEWGEPTQLDDSGMWVVSFKRDDLKYFQQSITVTAKGQIQSVNMIEKSLETVPDEYKDEQYSKDVAFMRSLADLASANDPVIGQSQTMPFVRTNDEFEYRKCMGGECPGGNLFADAMRWYATADFAFLSSGGIRGPGWPAGDVRVSDIWNMLPFSNEACVGTMSGLSLFRMLDYSTRLATFQSTWTTHGDRLLQVAGLRYTYNTDLPADETTSRLIRIEVLNRSTGNYEDVERLKLYKFATDAWMCGGFEPFPKMLTTDLTISGEQPGVIEPTLHQNIVQDYFEHLGSQIYDTNVQGRLVNDTDAAVPLDWNESPGDCGAGSRWMEDFQSCVKCPDTSNTIRFEQEKMEFDSISGSNDEFSGRAEIVNGEKYSVTLQLKSHPSWVQFPDADMKEVLMPGDVRSWDFSATSRDLEAGTASASISFQVRLEGSDFPTCSGNDAAFDVYMRVSPTPELSKPGSITATGLALMGLAVATSIFFGLWVLFRREKRIVKAMQPQFLTTICFGVAVIALSIVPLSIADDVSSLAGRDRACMATPWLLSMGFSIAILALYAKLWRINQVFNGQQFRRVTVTSVNVTLLCGVLATFNFLVLLLWTLIDPLKWVIRHVENEPWNQYGSCEAEGNAGTAFLILTLLFNTAILIIASHQAYKAKDISDEYSEAKKLGIALFGWCEIVLVGFPVLFLIERDNRNARYFLQVILITCICLSMQFIIFIPIIMHFQQHARRSPELGSNGKRPNHVKISGIQMPSYSSSVESNTKIPLVTNTTQTGNSDDDPERPRQDSEFHMSKLAMTILDEDNSY